MDFILKCYKELLNIKDKTKSYLESLSKILDSLLRHTDVLHKLCNIKCKTGDPLGFRRIKNWNQDIILV